MANRNLARKGRYGDTELRNVAGKKSHVNKKEANLIDLYGMIGQRLVQMEGSGTRNPRTGMPEYHWKGAPWSKHNKKHASSKLKDIGEGIKGFVEDPGGTLKDIGEDVYENLTQTPYDIAKDVYDKGKDLFGGDDEDDASSDMDSDSISDKFDRNAYMKAVQNGTEDAYLKSIGVPDDRLEYFQTNINKEYLTGEGDEPGFLERGKELTEAGATLSETTTEKQYGKEGEAYTGAAEAFRIGELGVTETKRAAGAQFGLGMEQAGLGARRSLFDVKQQGDVATARAGLATSGTIAATTGRAQKGIFQDYTSQQKQLAEAKTSALTRADITMAGVTEARRSTEAGADISYGGVMGFGTEGDADYVAGSADITRAGATLDYETGVSDIGQSAEDEFWKNLMAADQ